MNEVILNTGRKIGQGHPAYIMVDVAANHNGDLEIAKELIKKAAESGADAVKFQTYTADKLYSKKAPQFSRDPLKPYDLIKQVEHPREWLPVLYEYAKQFKIDFLSSPFDCEAVDLLEEIDVPFYKIASPEIVDLDFIRYVAAKGKPVILSTGMADMGEIEEALEVIQRAGNDNIILLQCTTSYPTPVHSVNLNAINTLSDVFKRPVGFSDHTLGWHIPLAAVAKGASVIEKHFTLSRIQKGPDHGFSIQPGELMVMIKQIREIEKAMGNGIKKVSKEEMENYEKGRRSLIAKTDIGKGTVITKEMVTAKRPGFGIKPKYLDQLIGREAKIDISEDDILDWKMFI